MTIPLSLTIIQSLLTKNIHLEIFDSIPSTNDYLLSQKQHDEAVCIAEHQTKGKGQLGREWHSPHGQNIYLSYCCVLPRPMGEIGGLSMLVGEGVCNVLRQFDIHQELTVKWPNDVLFEGKKIAGILIEVQAAANNSSRVVIGVGLNVNMMADADKPISQPWTAMQIIKGERVNRDQVAAALINMLVAQVK